jgi:hypothetical protein
MNDKFDHRHSEAESSHTQTRHRDRQPVVDSPRQQRTDAGPVDTLDPAAFPMISGSSAET